MKFGGDYRYLTASYTMPSVRLPARLFYTFNNSVTSVIGNPYAAFLLGVPDATTLDRCIQPTTEGYEGATLSTGRMIGRRPRASRSTMVVISPDVRRSPYNTAKLRPNYPSVINSKVFEGAVVVADQGLRR
jgi:hypothetical protein